MFYNVQEQEDRDFHYSSDAEIDSFGARCAGAERPEQAWILSDRDVWYANPFYRGPKQRHPEDDGYDDMEDDEKIECLRLADITQPDDCPF